MGLHRVLVCGGRDFTNTTRIFEVLDHYHREAGGFECLIHGAARGADTGAGDWGFARGIPVLRFPADWNTHGNAAGPIRNAQMIAEGKPTLVIAFPGGRGTGNMMRQARECWIPVLEIPA